MTLDSRLATHIADHPYSLVFATISGAHLYGFPSPDSDIDLRGAHILPLREIIGLKEGDETVEKSGIYEGLEIDLVTHDVKKFIRLMLQRNGYVLEQLLSPLVELSSATHEELRSLAPGCITKHHAHHYLGFAATQWKLFCKEEVPRVKPLLYVLRVLLTGIHLMKTGEVESNLRVLNEQAQLGYVQELIDRKTQGPEKGTLEAANVHFFEAEYLRLTATLESAFQSTWLPEGPSAAPALHDLLVRIRLAEPVSRTR